MENASKALTIAAGVILAMLVLALLVFARNKVGEFYDEKDKLIETTDTAKFNEQFSNYDREKVHGYELISLANKIADYNFRHSNYTDEVTGEKARNDEGYNPIKIIINFNGQRTKFTQDGTNRMFITNPLDVTGITNIIKLADAIETRYGGIDPAVRIAKSIDSLILSETQFTYNYNSKNMSRLQSEREALEKFNAICTTQKYEDYTTKIGNDLKDYRNMNNYLTADYNIMKYYEYYQFKRGIFKCTGIQFDSVSSRVSQISFDFTGNIE